MRKCLGALFLWCCLTLFVCSEAFSADDDDADDADDSVPSPPPPQVSDKKGSTDKRGGPVIPALSEDKKKAVEMELMAALDFEDDSEVHATTLPEAVSFSETTWVEAERKAKAEAERQKAKEAAEAAERIISGESTEDSVNGDEEIGTSHSEESDESESENGDEEHETDTHEETDDGVKWQAKDGGPTQEEREHFLRGWEDERLAHQEMVRQEMANKEMVRQEMESLATQDFADSDEEQKADAHEDVEDVIHEDADDIGTVHAEVPNEEERQHFMHGWVDLSGTQDSADSDKEHKADADEDGPADSDEEHKADADEDVEVGAVHAEGGGSEAAPAKNIFEFLYPDFEGVPDPDIISYNDYTSRHGEITHFEDPSGTEDGQKDGKAEFGTDDHLEAMHHKLDINGDGQLSVEELMQFAFQGHLTSSKSKALGILKQMDQNGDSELTFAELMQELQVHKDGGHTRTAGDDAEFQQVRAYQERRFKAADKNQNGVLDLNELPAFFFPETDPDALDKKTKEMLVNSDRDGDGKVDIKEFQAEFATMDSSFITEYSTEGSNATFASLDYDHDGELDLGELKSLTSGNFSMVRTLKEFISKADADHDGTVSVEEMTNARDDIMWTPTYFQLSQYAEPHTSDL